MSPRQTAQPTNHQPDQPPVELTPPVCYVSIRLTVPHSRWPEIAAAFSDVRYLAWPHFGKHKNNPHFHVLLPAELEKSRETYRKRCKKLLGVSGQRELAVKFLTNGILAGITYCKKEGTPAYLSDPSDQALVDAATPWIERDAPGIQQFLERPPERPRVREDHFKELTYRNMEKAVLRYRQTNGTRSTFEATVEHMLANGWRFSVSVLRQGIPFQIMDEVTSIMQTGKSLWTEGRVASMRRNHSLDWR